MAYVAVSGGKEAIKESIDLLSIFQNGIENDIDIAIFIENKLKVW